MMKLHRILRSLPFVPMALSTFDTIERSAASSTATGSTSHSFVSDGPPYFISPKHDGVRILSYVSEHAESLKSTCFSRFGRPVHGMFWIEEELRLLRWLCGDPRLVLDGELYVHKEPHARSTGDDGARTGFFSVSALVHRLRGPKSACSSEEEVLSYVASLPRLCVFDIVSFQPSDKTNLSEENSGRGLSRIEKERVSLLREVMKANGVRDLEMLRVIPNYSVFSQRLKVMHFLMCVLHRARASSILFPGRAVSVTTSKKNEMKRRNGNSSDMAVGVTNVGGEYLQLVKYSLLRSLDDAKKVYLKKYLSCGYEGAVIRSASNVYELKEKERGVLLGLLDPLISVGERPFVNKQAACWPKRSVLVAEAPPLLRTYAKNGLLASMGSGEYDWTDFVADENEAEEANHQAVVGAAVRRAKQNARRSTTAVKLLPFCDKEYAILKPLLKIPSANPRARKLVSVPLKLLHGGRDAISVPRTAFGKAASKKNEKSKVVVFYGLQCLSETGRVFNVSLPKMDVAKQRALLDHLLEVTGVSRKMGGKRNNTGGVGCRSLTGLYATVKYSSLTEYGIPRFGQVKAIRGGKGWFL
ncbi:DNA ligase, putative [Trypanosoma cruzi]|uniref:Putative DNA ligase n=1 Tax=Trypanosoma cruzi TaxID=5693 RepID=A0A2V2UX31_TRYCR|nr:DNA ligase, putative [Trypanosoma cruzi]PBJ74141.1 DNA ligase [Trypanosoma cruzi cruzi]PWU88604.1 putative DNA ligase [Trypanosoma cruzi]RNF20815.1 DNA ligase [Trypanosoma cruzi]